MTPKRPRVPDAPPPLACWRGGAARRPVRRATWVGLCALAALWLAGNVAAHQSGLSYLSLAVRPDGLNGRLDMALSDLAYALGPNAYDNGSLTPEEVQQRQQLIGEYLLRNLSCRADGQELALRIVRHDEIRDRDGVYATAEFVAGWARLPRQLEVTCRVFGELSATHRTLAQLEVDGERRTAVFRPAEPTHLFALRPTGKAEQCWEFLREGVWHIWRGYDHVLFLLALLLPAVLRRDAGRWQAVDRLRPAVVNVLKVVTAFTVAHSLTLTLAVLHVVSLPTRMVEAAVAASVALAAANNLWPLVRERTWLVAFGFGLIHGFAFASALGMLHLPAAVLALALVSFNLGVEAGQAVIVAAFLPVAFALRTRALYQRLLMRWGSALILVLAGVWLIQRLRA